MLDFERHGDLALLRVDDGKANVVSEAFSAAVDEGLDRAEALTQSAHLQG